MRNSHLTARSLWLALALSLPASAQSSTTNSTEHKPPEAPSQSAPSQSTPSQAAPSQAGAASEAVPGHPQAQAQAQAGEDNPLNLTDEQKAKLRPILAEENQQLDTLRNDTSMTQEQKISKANEIRQTASPKIRAILTQEQLQKLADLQKAKQQKNQSAPPDAASPPHQ